VIIVALVALAWCLAYERDRRKQDGRIFRSLLAEESAQRIFTERQMQRHAVSLERQIIDTQTALMFVAWRLTENGVLDPSDAPADDSNQPTIH
jgi:hypothetical protein